MIETPLDVLLLLIHPNFLWHLCFHLLNSSPGIPTSEPYSKQRLPLCQLVPPLYCLYFFQNWIAVLRDRRVAMQLTIFPSLTIAALSVVGWGCHCTNSLQPLTQQPLHLRYYRLAPLANTHLSLLNDFSCSSGLFRNSSGADADNQECLDSTA